MWNSKIFFDGVFLSIFSHLLKKLKLSKLCRKKVGILVITCRAAFLSHISRSNKPISFILLYYLIWGLTYNLQPIKRIVISLKSKHYVIYICDIFSVGSPQLIKFIISYTSNYDKELNYRWKRLALIHIKENIFINQFLPTTDYKTLKKNCD